MIPWIRNEGENQVLIIDATNEIEQKMIDDLGPANRQLVAMVRHDPGFSDPHLVVVYEQTEETERR